MDDKELYLRRLYYFYLNGIFIVIYLLRYLSLAKDRGEFIFSQYNYSFDKEIIPFTGIVIFIIVMNICGMIIPVRKKVDINKLILPKSSLWFNWFYIGNILTTILFLISGYSMGSKTITSYLNPLHAILNIVSFDFLCYLLLMSRMTRTEKIYDLALIYILPYLAKGSKSGIFNFFFFYFSIKVVLGLRIKFKAYLSVGTLAALLYPLIYSISYYFRVGKARGFRLLEFINYNMQYLLQNNNWITLAFSMLSRRINGIDVLMFKPFVSLEQEFFSVKVQIIYFLKGLFSSGVVSFFSPEYKYSWGAKFAEVCRIPNAGGIETTLFGNIYFSNYNILMIIFTIVLVLIFLSYSKWGKNGILAAFIIIQITMLMMTGSVQNVSYIVRNYFIFCIINLIVKKVRIKI